MAKVKVESLSHYAVILIALSALVVSVWQVRISHQHNKLSVKPFLDFHINQVDSILNVSFSNQGVGPAILKEISFKTEEKTYQRLEEWLRDNGEIRNRLGSYNYNANTVVAPGDDKLLVILKGNTIRGVKVRLVYWSIYEEEQLLEFTF